MSMFLPIVRQYLLIYLYFTFIIDSTDDEDLKNLLELMTEDNTTSAWDKVVDEKKILCYKRSVEGSSCMVIKAIATIEGFNKEEVFEAIYDLKLRMSWDSVFRDFKVVRPETETSPEILYMSIKVRLNK